MSRAVALALQHGSAIGAHPSFPDRANFGRRALELPLLEITRSVVSQIEALARLADLHHVKPHGALYNEAQREEDLAEAIVEGVSRVLPTTIIYTLPGGALARAAREAGHEVAGEGFIDRGYQENGELVPRSDPGALLAGQDALEQALRLAARGDIATLCVHGDSPEALSLLREVRARLEGFVISQP